ncbi:MAG: EamA family transporter, partial [Gemmatimonadota bacterium]
AVMAAGLVLFFVGADAPARTAPDPVRGNVLATMAGVAWAFTVIGLRWMSAGREPGEGAPSAASAVVLGNIFAFLGGLPMALPLGSHPIGDWGVLVYLGIFQIALAYVLVTGAIGEVSALEASLLLLVEPAFNPLWAWLAHGEIPGPWAAVGGAIILSATVVRSMREAPARRHGSEVA